jgi:oligoendopeptidase F
MAKEGYSLGRWSLVELFPSVDAPELKVAINELDEAAKAFEAYREELTDDLTGKKFKEILDHYDSIVRQMSRLGGFSSLSFSENTQDQDVQSFLAKMQQISADVDNKIMFFKLWWKGLDDDVAERLQEVSEDYAYWLVALRLHRPYTLTEPEEKIVNIKDVNGPRAMVTLYTTMTNRYSYQLEIEGEALDLTRAELEVYRRSTDPEVRAASYQEQFRVYKADSPILGQIYQYIVRDWHSEGVNLRGYASPLAMRNLANDIPDEVVDTLLRVCQENASLFHRFFKLKGDLLKVDRLRRYDLYAPVAKAEKTYAFPDAVDMIISSFERFDPRFADFTRRVFDEEHIDSEVRKGKRSGAFCATVTPDLTPWILQSYTGKPRDVSTLAHELGHAIHSMLADHHSALTQHASLPLAETASTFGEMVFIDYLLEREEDQDVRRDVLFTQMDDAYATIMRQAYFALFEKEAHARIQAGASVDDLNEVYLVNLRNQFGDSIDLSDDFQHEWITIPHIYGVPFYVYAYAFGQLLVLSLYQQYQEEGESFKPRYIEILTAGGSEAPIAILDRAGIDVRSEAFWQGGFDVVKARLEQLEALPLPG